MEQWIYPYLFPAILNLISTIILSLGLRKIRVFIKQQNEWKHGKDKLMAVHLILFSCLTIFEFCVFFYVISENDNYVRIVTMSFVYHIFNFAATSFIIYLFWVFSRGLWYKKLKRKIEFSDDIDNEKLVFEDAKEISRVNKRS